MGDQALLLMTILDSSLYIQMLHSGRPRELVPVRERAVMTLYDLMRPCELLYPTLSYSVEVLGFMHRSDFLPSPPDRSYPSLESWCSWLAPGSSALGARLDGGHRNGLLDPLHASRT